MLTLSTSSRASSFPCDTHCGAVYGDVFFPKGAPTTCPFCRNRGRGRLEIVLTAFVVGSRPTLSLKNFPSEGTRRDVEAFQRMYRATTEDTLALTWVPEGHAPWTYATTWARQDIVRTELDLAIFKRSIGDRVALKDWSKKLTLPQAVRATFDFGETGTILALRSFAAV